MRIYDLKAEYRENPLGLGERHPRFSWKIQSDRQNVMQISYRVQAFSDKEGKMVLWDSTMVESDQSIAIRYDGDELHSHERVYWNVNVVVKDGDGNQETAWSEMAWFEMGILDCAEWKAVWIEPKEEVQIEERMPAPYLRREFAVKAGLKTARIYQSAHGLYEFWINGASGTEDKFKPGYTAYDKRIQYQAYDITALLQEGTNCLAVALGDGWWRGTTGGSYRNNFGYKVAYIGQVLLEYEDGSREWIVSDESFKVSMGGLLSTDMREGESFDARLEPEGWKLSGYDDSSWNSAYRMPNDCLEKSKLVAAEGVPVREMEVFLPKKIETPDGGVVLDVGQNIAGYVKMRFRELARGQKITLTHGETLDENGNFTQKNLVIQSKKRLQCVEYTAKGDGEEVYCPQFSVSGFRYILIQGYEGEIKEGDFQAVAVYSAMGDTGDFVCSHPLVNQLVCNSRWSQKGNFLDVPTDCPTRERNPWSGDSQIYARTAAKFMNVYSFFEKWLADMTLEQRGNGKIPITIPVSTCYHNPEELARVLGMVDAMQEDDIMKLVLKMTLGTPEDGAIAESSSGWGDAAVIVPYTMYLSYGDRQILKNQYPCAKRWVDYIMAEAQKESGRYRDMPWYEKPEDAKYVWDTDFHFGEWCEPGTPSNPFLDLYQNPDYNTATMYYFYSSRLLSEMAGILGLEADKEKYGRISEEVRRVFNQYFIGEDGTIKEGRQAPNVRALAFGLADDAHKGAVASKLAEMIRENGYKLNTGFLSTPYLLPVLVDCGYVKEAFRVLVQMESPGWLANVAAGATTILEHWDGFEKCEASFNHYSYGAVCSFLFEYVGGIRPDIRHPGYKCFMIKPVVDQTLTEAKAEYESPYGKIVSHWKRIGETVSYTFTVPPNSRAAVWLLADEEGYERLKKMNPNMEYKDGHAVAMVGSGKWNYEVGKGERTREEHE